jgi:hypothetical protein
MRNFSCGALLAAVISACSGCSESLAAKPEAGDAAGPTVRQRPEGPAADVSEEITGGNGPFIAAGAGFAVPAGYVDHEYVASGTATAYVAKGALTDDGRWTLEPGATAAYRSRILVRRPQKASDASGTVIVEWLNVSGGADANPEYASLEEEILRQGHTWVGVSAQLIGVEGGPVLVTVPGGNDVAGKGLKAIDAARYGSLQHPGDGYSFDIFTQAARAVLENQQLLGGAKPRALLAAGESQSAFALTTYYDGVQPLTLVFDGFLLHSRGSASLPLVAPGASADLAGSIGSATHPILRDDLDAPAMDLQAEGDVTGILNSSTARQPDSDRFRLWEVAGTAHADAHLVGPLASSIDCGAPINKGPLHIVAKAALRSLDTWVRAGKAPLVAPLLELTEDGGTRAIRRNDDGIALGGIRTPPVEVPVDVLSGAPGPSTAVICLLLGSAKPLPAARLAQLYPTRATYQQKYDAATDEAIHSGFVLEADRDALLAFAEPSRINP